MTQNTSSAVMAQRVEARDSLDDFPTPPWATRALCEHVIHAHGWRLEQLAAQSVWEPACNRGFMVRPLGEYFKTVHASDAHDYGVGYPVDDFLIPSKRRADWIVTNPPFRLALDFALAARDRSRQGVALLCRSAWSEGIDRYQRLFRPHPPAIVAQFAERVPMVKGRVDPEASTATSYAWFVWRTDGRHFGGTQQIWIPPCRRELERHGDYEGAGSASVTAPRPGGASAVAANQDLLGPARRHAEDATFQPQTGQADIIAKLVSEAGRVFP